MWHQPRDGEVCDVVGNGLGGERTVRTEPLRGPVQGTEKRARRDRRIARGERAPGDAGRDERAHAALVAVALGDDDRAALRRQRVDLEMRRRSFDFGDQAQRVTNGELAQPIRQRPAIALGGGEGGEQAIQRPVLAEEQDFVLAAKVVIEVRGRQIGGDGDIAHAGGGEATAAEDLRRGAQDVDAPRLGADRTTVRKLNHGSILADLAGRPLSRGPDRRPAGGVDPA